MKAQRFILFAIAAALPVFGSVTYSCDATIAADGPSGLCNYLNTTFAGIYGSAFSNANASILIQYANNGGLADSTTGFYNLVKYSTYQSALQSESTDSAKAFVPVLEPGTFSTDDVEVTSALANALGITTVDGGGSVAGTTAGGGACFTPGNGAALNVNNASSCYNGIIQVNIPADLQAQHNQGYTYRSLGGSTTGTTTNYDFFTVVEHETDEVLGTSSCIGTGGAGGTLTNPVNCAAAVDLFRYTSSGTRTFNTIGANAYFSPDGGVTDPFSNNYNNQANSQDWADFSSNCKFVQDRQGCLSSTGVDITNDNGSGGAGPEVAILNAVGYNTAPEPATFGLLGVSLVALAIVRQRRRS